MTIRRLTPRPRDRDVVEVIVRRRDADVQHVAAFEVADDQDVRRVIAAVNSGLSALAARGGLAT